MGCTEASCVVRLGAMSRDNPQAATGDDAGTGIARQGMRSDHPRGAGPRGLWADAMPADACAASAGVLGVPTRCSWEHMLRAQAARGVPRSRR